MTDKTNNDPRVIPGDIEKKGIAQAFIYLKKHVTDQNVNCTLEMEEMFHKISQKKVVINLFLIAQEAIENAIVHGKATNIKIALTKKYSQLHLDIKDDGIGLSSLEIKKSGGKGIEFMKHDVEEMDGRLTIKSITTSGKYNTCVTCTIPQKKVLNRK